jgi:hypothetical protein
MATQPEPIDAPTEFNKLADLTRKLLRVPKSEVDELRRKRDEGEAAEA